MKAQAKSLMKRLHNLQSAIYNYQSALEDKSESAKSELKQKKYSELAELAGESGFELDTAQAKMEDLIKTFEQ